MATAQEQKAREHADTEREEYRAWHGPPPIQDVMYGLERGYFGVTGEVSPWNDPAIDAMQESFWMRSFVLTNTLS